MKTRDLRMYILVNKDIEIGKGKLAGQVGHAVNVQVWNMCQNPTTFDLLSQYMQSEIKKIVLYASQSQLEELERLGMVAIRDKGYTQLEPNTLTCVNYGILDYESLVKSKSWLLDLKLVR